MKRATFIASFLAAVAMVASFCLGLALIGLLAWGNAARDTVAVAFGIAMTMQLVASIIARITRHRWRGI